MEMHKMTTLHKSFLIAGVLAAMALAGCATQGNKAAAEGDAAATPAVAATTPAPAATAGCAGNACDVAPQLITGAAPRYPFPEGTQAQPASVRVQFVVNTDGSVGDVKTLTATSKDMAGEVERAVKRWNYRPATKGGQPIKVILQQQFDFKP
ncbi:hypothetical protein GCM10027082_10590 [Comamonas humi]